MNNDRIKVLTNIYLLRLDDLMAGGEDPRARWRAAASCVRNWDIDAEDFAAMFREALGDARRFLQPKAGEDISRPMDGVLALCDAGRSEDVRKAFEALLEEADVVSRQEQVHSFVKRINELLEDEFPDEWRYRQKMRDGIGYLAFLHPADNYYYRAPETALFAGYTEADEEIGYERSFSMPAYYRFCSEVSLYLMSRKDVQEAITKALASEAAASGAPAKGRPDAGTADAAEGKQSTEEKISESQAGAASDDIETSFHAGITEEDLSVLDPELHLLTADLIHCAYADRFYEDKAANRKSRISTASQRRIEKARQQAQLLEQRDVAAGHLDEVSVRETGAGLPNLQGRQVRHKAFGEGTVTIHDGKYLTVVFPKGTKKFALPGVVVGGYLSFEDAEKVVAACGAMDKIVTERRKFADELSAIDVQLRMLE